MMQPRDLQMVLDRLVATYDELSPQILRDAVEYAKFQSTSPSLVLNDGAEGKNSLFVRTQGYIEGYCHIYDGYYNEDAIDIKTDEYTEDVMACIREDYGEDAPTAYISSCADFALLVASMRNDDTEMPAVKEVVRNAAIGYMDGALAYDSARLFNRYIRPVFLDYPEELAHTAYAIIGDETHLEVGDADAAEQLEDAACACLTEMMEKNVIPKSGNISINSDDNLICAMMYLLGYLKGLLPPDADAAFEIEDVTEVAEDKLRAIRIANAKLSMWTQYNGYAEQTFEHAAKAMKDNTLLDDMVGPDNEVQENDGTLATLFGMGYADGYWMMNDDEELSDREKEELDIAMEVNAIFAGLRNNDDDNVGCGEDI